MTTRPTTAIFGFGAICATAIFSSGCASDDIEQDTSLAARSFHTDGMEEHLSNARAARGRLFLAENEIRSGVKTRPSGLQFEVLQEGDGERPSLRSSVVTHYKVSTVDGALLDNSEDYGEPQEFRVDQVIAGWREALQEMRVGAKWKLFVPPELAYGDQGLAQIPGGETLIYELELLGVKHGDPTAPEEFLAETLDPAPDAAPATLSSTEIREPGTPVRGDLSLDNLDLLD